MKKFFVRIYKMRYFLLFILIFAYAQSIHHRIVARDEWGIYIFTPEAAVATLLAVSLLFWVIGFFIWYWQKSDVFNTVEMMKIFGSSILVYILAMQTIGLIIAYAFGNIERNFNIETVSRSTLSYLLEGFVYGSFFLAYYYYDKNKKHQAQLIAYHQAFAEVRVRQLKTQLNPHFLFNNLNILDQLIDEDKNKASEFLNEFAEIYRYVLQASDKKLVTVDEELVFARRYFKLINHKYGAAYQLHVENPSRDGYIVPLTLQLLIENAVQHNLGTVVKPVNIKVKVAAQIVLSNTYIPKRDAKPKSGRALNNLKEQYKILVDSPVEVHKSDYEFAVIIPIIQSR